MAAKRTLKASPSARKEEDAAPTVVEQATTDDVLRCQCGEPVAPGQTSVCRAHIRST